MEPYGPTDVYARSAVDGPSTYLWTAPDLLHWHFSSGAPALEIAAPGMQISTYAVFVRAQWRIPSAERCFAGVACPSDDVEQPFDLASACEFVVGQIAAGIPATLAFLADPDDGASLPKDACPMLPTGGRRRERRPFKQLCANVRWRERAIGPVPGSEL